MISMRPAASTAGDYRRRGATIVDAVTPEWRNWQTRGLKRPCPKGRVGSNPTSGIDVRRYTLTNPDPTRLRARFDILESVEVDEEPRFNIAPTDPVLAVRRREDGARARPAALGAGPGRWASREAGGR